MTTLLLKQNDIPSLTSFDGNIDADKIKPYIYLAQKNDVKKALGAKLYKKIYDDYVADNLSGIYQTIYDEYVVEMLVYYSCSKYMNFGGVKVSNNGVYRVSFGGASTLTEKEVAKQVSLYNQMGANVETSFLEYMSDKDISSQVPEYSLDSDNTTQNKVIPWF